MSFRKLAIGLCLLACVHPSVSEAKRKRRGKPKIREVAQETAKEGTFETDNEDEHQPTPPPPLKKPKPAADAFVPAPEAAQNATADEPELTDIENELYKIDLAAANQRDRLYAWTSPATAIGIPGGYGGDWGAFFLGTTFAHYKQGTSDGTVYGGFGIGNAKKLLGIEIGAMATDIDNPGDSGTTFIKIHRRLPYDVGIAVGTDYLFSWGKFGNDVIRSYYVSTSKTFRFKRREEKPFSSFSIHAGLGNGRFMSRTDYLAKANKISPFFGLGVRILPGLSIAADWAGQYGDVGISIAPFRSFRLVVTPAMSGLGASDGPFFLLSVAYAESFFSDTFPMIFGR